MLDRILSAPVVVVASALLALGVTAYLNMSEVNRDKEARTVRLRQSWRPDRAYQFNCNRHGHRPGQSAASARSRRNIA
jgi:hypothetical protein